MEAEKGSWRESIPGGQATENQVWRMAKDENEERKWGKRGGILTTGGYFVFASNFLIL